MKRIVNSNSIVFMIAVSFFVAVVVGCAGGLAEWWQSGGVQRTILEEAADTAGYTLGLLAAKDDNLRARVEAYYAQVQAGGVTMAIINEGLGALLSEGVAYQILARKLLRIVQLAGGSISPDGNITDLGAITTDLLIVGKDGYLQGFAAGQAS